MALFTDQMHRAVALELYPPRRIVSLVPSQTELLGALGLDAEVVGITKFCVHPERWFRSKTRVGGTKTVHLDRVAALAPDLIIGNLEENDREQIEALAAQFPVWMSDVRGLDDALRMIDGVGQLTGKSEAAQAMCSEIRRRFAALPPPERPLRAAYFIWRKPYMAAGSDTFIDAMLAAAGFENVFRNQPRYPEVSLEALAAARPELIMLSSEPFPFSEKHVGAFREACPGAQIKMVNGEMFSWYGSRLLEAPAYFQDLLAGYEDANQA
ncbi:MAG: ABC transporter substrate-binding protein [Saprospiraceae bacterium]|nr:ABC transporter substrate-binding protein [Saprospiraceae bacterium]